MTNKGIKWIATCFIIIGIIGVFVYGVQDPHNKQAEYTKKWTMDAEGLKNLMITSDFDIDVEFIESPDQSSYVELSGKLPTDVIQHLDTLQPSVGKFNLTIQNKQKFQLLFSFDFPRDQKMIVALAKDAKLQSIESDSGSSSMHFKGARAENINIAFSSGDIDVEQIQGTHIQIEGDSGNISAQGVEGDIQTKLSSGDIKLQDVKGDLQARASSGNINVENHEGAAILHTSSGDIELVQRTISPIDASADSGNVEMTIPETFEGFYDVQAGSGSTSTPESKMLTKDVIKARTGSGDITIRKD